MLRAGQTIGMGHLRGEVSLLVEIRSLQGVYLTGHVINGAWGFTYNLVTQQLIDDREGGHAGVTILFSGPVPKEIRGYNDIIYYMNKQLHHTWLGRFTECQRVRIAGLRHWKASFWPRLHGALAAFKYAWRHPAKALPPIDDFDDSIPF